MDENEQNVAMNAFLSYHYGNYRFLQKRWGADVMPLNEWISKIGFVKLWGIYEKLCTELAELRQDKDSNSATK